MTTNLPLSNQSVSTAFAAIIEKYRRERAYGEQWATNHAEKIIEGIRQACAAKDYAYLRTVCYPDEAFMREVFTSITGIALHHTWRESKRVVQEFVGPEAVAAYQQQQEDTRKRKQFERLCRQVAVQQVNTPQYGTLTMDAFIRKLVAEGYTTISEQKRGVATEWFLWNAQHSGYTFRRRMERDYIVALLEQQQAAAQEESDGREQQEGEKNCFPSHQ